MAKRASVAGINMDRRSSRPHNMLSRQHQWGSSHHSHTGHSGHSGHHPQHMSVWHSQSSMHWSSMSIDQQEEDSEVMTQLYELNKDADDTLEFVLGVTEIVSTTGPFIFIIIAIGVFEVMAISAGVKYLEDCPVAPNIPIFLFVGGCVGLLKAIYTLHTVMKQRRHPESGEAVFTQASRGTRRIIDTALNLFLCVWQLAGTVWTLQVWCPNFHPPLHDPDNWCPKALYVFAIVEINVFFGLFVLCVLFNVGLAVCYNYTTIFEG